MVSEKRVISPDKATLRNFTRMKFKAIDKKDLSNAKSKSAAIVSIAQSYERRLSTRIKWKLATLLILTLLKANAQVVPNLFVTDNFRPYLTEEQKRQEIFKAKTSQELHPKLYQDKTQENLDQLIKQGLMPNPNDAFRNQVQIGFPQSNLSSSHFGQQSEENKRQIAAYEADLAAYQEQQSRSQQIIEEANKELYTPTINYTLGFHSGSKVDRFVKAYNELESMLSGKQKIDFVKAVWLVESAHDESLSWGEFNTMFQSGVDVISALMVQDKVNPNDNLSKIMTIYKFMADTTKVYIKAKEKTIVSKPMLYDYEDYAGKKDISKVFVSKLLRTGTGQCMSLPMLYYLYAKTFGADVHMAFAPQHSYVTFKDNLGNWQNIELTARMFIATDFHWQSGFITTEQIKSGIYLRPSTEKETIAYLLTTLALSYVKTIGSDDRLLQMATTAKQYFPKNLTANMIYAGYYKDLYINILRQYDVYRLPEDKFNNDEQRKKIEQQALGAAQYVKKDLGWREMPDWAYKKWLDGVNNLANKNQHIVRRRQLEQQLNRHK